MRNRFLIFALCFFIGLTIIVRSHRLRNDLREPITPVAKVRYHGGVVVVSGYLFRDGPFAYRVGDVPIKLAHPMNLEPLLGKYIEAKGQRLSIIGEFVNSIAEVREVR